MVYTPPPVPVGWRGVPGVGWEGYTGVGTWVGTWGGYTGYRQDPSQDPYLVIFRPQSHTYGQMKAILKVL